MPTPCPKALSFKTLMALSTGMELVGRADNISFLNLSHFGPRDTLSSPAESPFSSLPLWSTALAATSSFIISGSTSKPRDDFFNSPISSADTGISVPSKWRIPALLSAVLTCSSPSSASQKLQEEEDGKSSCTSTLQRVRKSSPAAVQLVAQPAATPAAVASTAAAVVSTAAAVVSTAAAVVSTAAVASTAAACPAAVAKSLAAVAKSPVAVQNLLLAWRSKVGGNLLPVAIGQNPLKDHQ
ncbi:hypothetical protein Ndes2526B_g00719 [Nannochloris sp. 'desiccata']